MDAFQDAFRKGMEIIPGAYVWGGMGKRVYGDQSREDG